MIYIAYLLFIGFGYTSEDMNSNHKNVVVDMISRSFAEKGDLTTLAKVTYDDLYEQVTILWESLLEANLSFVIRDSMREEDDQIIGACLNFDARSKEAEPLCAISAFERANVDIEMNEEEEQSDTNEELEVEKEEKQVPMTVVEFLQSVEEPLKDEHLPAGLGKTIYTSLLGTSSKVCAADNVKVILKNQFVYRVLALCRMKQFFRLFCNFFDNPKLFATANPVHGNGKHKDSKSKKISRNLHY